MIIRIIATALIQCTVRTHAGWRILAWAGMALVSLAARLDIAIPRLFRLSNLVPLLYAGSFGFVTAIATIRSMPAGYRGHENASRVAPARDRASWWGPGQDERGCYDGIRTVSTTWITPFDWLTFGIVTAEESPLASMIITVLPERFTVSV